jgi:hypothetical protein
MFKNLITLEIAVADKIYHFTCAPDSPIEHIKEVLFQIQKYVGQIEDGLKAQAANAAAQAEPPLPEEVKAPETPVEDQPGA